mgnify:CR=1 FL=1
MHDKMREPLKPVRRILTGTNPAGRSFIEFDGPAGATKELAERPGYRVTNLWRTAAGESLHAADAVAEHIGVLPPAGGSVLRIIEWPPEPEDPAELARLMDLTFGSMFSDAHRSVRPGEHPGMHQTDTIDYAIVLDGEIVAILDEGETVMRAGDVLVQRATRHAWANRSGKPVKVAFVLTRC